MRDMSRDTNLYLDAYDAAVLEFWGEMLSRHLGSLRRPYARDWARLPGDDDEDRQPESPPAGIAPDDRTPDRRT